MAIEVRLNMERAVLLFHVRAWLRMVVLQI